MSRGTRITDQDRWNTGTTAGTTTPAAKVMAVGMSAGTVVAVRFSASMTVLPQRCNQPRPLLKRSSSPSMSRQARKQLRGTASLRPRVSVQMHHMSTWAARCLLPRLGCGISKPTVRDQSRNQSITVVLARPANSARRHDPGCGVECARAHHAGLLLHPPPVSWL